MLSFESDYTTGAHPKILEQLLKTNMEPQPGYGSDDYSKNAKEKIRTACGCPDAEVYFLTGGTQTNAIVISTMLRDSEGVVAAKTGHVSVHEAGAIEHSGHKVLELSQENGKINSKELDCFLSDFYKDPNHEHMVYPGMVYISHPTEYGTLYSKAELTELSQICKAYNIPLYMDGARLGYGLMSNDTDVTLADIARLCDVFYIGGTKVGVLCGEAVVFTKKGYPFYLESPTNQQFIILENTQMEKLSEQVAFSFWEPFDEGHCVVRFATSWSTTEGDLTQLERIL